MNLYLKALAFLAAAVAVPLVVIVAFDVHDTPARIAAALLVPAWALGVQLGNSIQHSRRVKALSTF